LHVVGQRNIRRLWTPSASPILLPSWGLGHSFGAAFGKLTEAQRSQIEADETATLGGSRRIIRLQNWVIARLKDLKQCQAENPVVDPEEWPEAVDLIFVTDFGRPVNVNSLGLQAFQAHFKTRWFTEHQAL